MHFQGFGEKYLSFELFVLEEYGAWEVFCWRVGGWGGPWVF